MKKFAIVFLILFLILSTAIIKNSTKRFEDEIFVIQENIQILEKEYENIKLEFDYLSSAEKLLDLKNLYFDDSLIKKDIQEIKVINLIQDNIEIGELKFINEK